MEMRQQETPEQPSDRLDALGRRPLFTVGETTYFWGDVLVRARAQGSLERQLDLSRRGAARVRHSYDLSNEPDPDVLGAAAVSFRYDHGLLSAEELEAWLGRWSLTVTEWGEYLERTLSLERGPELASGNAVPEAEYVDAVCSGFLEREALAFAADAALAALDADEGAPARAELLERIDRAAAAERARAVSGPGVEREISMRGLDWTRITTHLLEVDERGVADEAALCVRLDRRPIGEVAEECDTALECMDAYLADVEPALAPLLLAAQPGELIGPVERDGSFLLIAVNERTPPSSADPELRSRAETALVERAVRRAIESRLEWLEHL